MSDETPRLKTALWARAMLRLADLQGRSGMLMRRGDVDGGTVLVVLRDRSGGMTVLSQVRATDGSPAWLRATGAEPVDQPAVDAYVERALKRDPDLWVLEFDGPDLKPPFEAVLL